MTDTVTIASRLPMAIRITEPDPSPEKPGLSPTLKTAVINGTNTPGAAGEGITNGVDADLFKSWSEAQGNSELVSHLRVMNDGEADEPAPGAGYGFEPGLDALIKDGDNTDLATKGSATTSAGPIPAADMKTGGEAPAAPVVAETGAATSPKPASGSAKGVPGALPLPDKK